MSATQDDLHPRTDLAHLIHKHADTLARLIRLTGNLLAPGQNALGFAEVHDQCASLEPLHGAIDNLAEPLGVIVEYDVTLRLAYLLDHHLLCRLRCDTSQLTWTYIPVVLAGKDLARLTIYLHIHFFGRVSLARGAGKCLLNPLEHYLLVNVLVTVDAVHQTQQFRVHRLNLSSGFRIQDSEYRIQQLPSHQFPLPQPTEKSGCQTHSFDHSGAHAASVALSVSQA